MGEQRLQLALEAGRMGTWEWDIAAGRVTWSPGLEAIHGLAAGSFAGTFEAYQEDIHPQDRDYVQRSIEATLKEGIDHRIEYRIVRPDGSLRWVEGRGKLFRDGQGNAWRMMGICSDITERKAADERLRRNEQELADFFETAAIGLHWVGPDGRILRTNRAELQMLGYERDEYVGHHIAEFHADRTAIDGMLALLARGEQLREHPAQMRCKDGSIRDVLVSSSALFENGRFVHTRCFTYDVTERKRAEEMRLRLAAIVEASDDAIIGHDLNGRITAWNRGAERLYGYRPDEMIGEPIARLFPADHQDDFPRILQRLRSGERVEHYETVRVSRDGRRIDVSLTISPIRNASGEIVGASKIARDISERKHVEETLRARVRQQEAVAMLGELALREADLQRVFQHATKALAETLQIECCKVLELLPDGRELLLRAGVGWRAGLVGSARVGTGLDSQAGYTLQSNTPVIVADMATEPRFHGPALLLEHGVTSGMSCVIRGPAGAPWGVLGCHSKRALSFTQDDVNFLTAVANVLSHAIHRERTEQALREADRRKDEFIATLSHELRNPLAPIRSALELLRMQNVGMDPVQIYEIMERQVSHLVRLVDDLLEISRVERGVVELRREPLRLNDVLHSAIETSTPLIDEAGHLLEVDLPPEPLWVNGDGVRLAQIFANLLNNAARFTGRGGSIRVAVERSNGSVTVAVRDTGIGFSEHTRARLFEMFSRSPQSSGLGIGLALARRLVEMHGGTVTAQSAGEGRGAEFVVRLPRIEPPARPAGQPKATQASDAGEAGAERYRVLVADDNRDAAESLGMLLRILGNDVMLAFDGEEAVAVARAFQPHAVLLDVGMPKLDGYGAAREIRRYLEKVRLIALTGWGQESDRQRAREASFDAHLVKPAEIDALRSVLAGQAPQQR